MTAPQFIFFYTRQVVKLRVDFCEFGADFCKLEPENGDFGLIFEGVKSAKNSHFSLFTFLYFFPRIEKKISLEGEKNFALQSPKKDRVTVTKRQ